MHHALSMVVHCTLKVEIGNFANLGNGIRAKEPIAVLGMCLCSAATTHLLSAVCCLLSAVCCLWPLSVHAHAGPLTRACTICTYVGR